MSRQRNAVLEVLRDGPSYGLEIIERVRAHTGGEIQLHQGNVYPLLRDLEGEGLVESYDGDPLPERKGRPRRYYRLTEDGHRELRKIPSVPGGLLGGLFGGPVSARCG